MDTRYPALELDARLRGRQHCAAAKQIWAPGYQPGGTVRALDTYLDRLIMKGLAAQLAALTTAHGSSTLVWRIDTLPDHGWRTLYTPAYNWRRDNDWRPIAPFWRAFQATPIPVGILYDMVTDGDIPTFVALPYRAGTGSASGKVYPAYLKRWPALAARLTVIDQPGQDNPFSTWRKNDDVGILGNVANRPDLNEPDHHEHNWTYLDNNRFRRQRHGWHPGFALPWQTFTLPAGATLAD